MGIFGDILNIFSGIGARKAQSRAAQVQVDAFNRGITGIGNENNRIQGVLSPYTGAGDQAVTAEGQLLGLGGSGDQQRWIDQLKSSPLYQSEYRNGVDTILQNGAATGGLRGGNIQGSLANFGQDTLARVIQQELAGLGGLSSQGLQASNQSGTFGANAADNIASLQGLIGRTQAGGILGKSAVDQGLWQSGGQLVQDAINQIMQAMTGGAGGGAGGNPFAALMGGGSGGGISYGQTGVSPDIVGGGFT